MKSKILIICLYFMSTLVYANNEHKIEDIEVKIKSIDYNTQTIDYVQNNRVKTLKLDPEIINMGYYDSESNPVELKNMKLNRNYFLRIIHENYKDDNNKQISENFVFAISTVKYDKLF